MLLNVIEWIGLLSGMVLGLLKIEGFKFIRVNICLEVVFFF